MVISGCHSEMGQLAYMFRNRMAKAIRVSIFQASFNFLTYKRKKRL
jgi:hypothetical protein